MILLFVDVVCLWLVEVVTVVVVVVVVEGGAFVVG